jgi:ATP-dependent DNA helicase RecG
MTATPIPRTLSMTVFGDLDVSVIKHSPPGRGRVITRVVPHRKLPEVLAYVRKRLEAGEQAYVVCPLIGGQEAPEPRSDEGETERSRDQEIETSGRAAGASRSKTKNPESKITSSVALASATETWRALRDGAWRGLNVELLHGGMQSSQKQRLMAEFAAGELHALVATTVVEVGVDVPNATMMLVEHAERFGLSQLHQLRGRIGRGGKNGLCVLIAHGRGGKSAERLDVMARTTDGFKIAEADLRQRGPGELLGTRQHGLPELRVGDIVDDFALLETARNDAFAIVADDPLLRKPDHARMIPALKRLFGGKLALIDAA